MTTTEEFRRNSDNFCYRHPDRQSFVLCQRCLRTICPECQTQGAVGVICPECMAEQRKSQSPAQKKAQRRWARGARSAPVAVAAGARPIVTYAIIALTALAFVIGLIPGIGPIVSSTLSFYAPALYPDISGVFQPWRLLTVALVHSSFWHIGLNMLALWFLGRTLEPLLGKWRFLTLYLLSVLGGSVAVALLAPNVPVVGASGGIFGLFGALLIIGRHLGADIRVIAILIAINFALPFVLALFGAIASGSFAGALAAIQISWQAHLGGLVAGVGVGLIYARTRARRQRGLQTALLVVLTVVLLALLALPPVLYAG